MAAPARGPRREPVRSSRWVRVYRWRRRHAAGHRRQHRGAVPAAPGCDLPSEREDRLPQRLCSRRRQHELHQLPQLVLRRCFAWAMPTGRFANADNPFVPSTTLRQGLIVPGGAPDTSSGRILLPQNVGTTTYAKDVERGTVHSFNVAVQREFTRWLTGQVAYVGTRANGQMNFVNVNAAAPGTGNAGRPLVLAGLTNVNSDINVFSPVRRHGLQRPANEFQGSRAATRRSMSPTRGRRPRTTPTTPAGTLPAPAVHAFSTCRRRSATRVWPATIGPTTSRCGASTTCPSAKASDGRPPAYRRGSSAAGRSMASGAP